MFQIDKYIEVMDNIMVGHFYDGVVHLAPAFAAFGLVRCGNRQSKIVLTIDMNRPCENRARPSPHTNSYHYPYQRVPSIHLTPTKLQYGHSNLASSSRTYNTLLCCCQEKKQWGLSYFAAYVYIEKG